jgi:hypothetical protein
MSVRRLAAAVVVALCMIVAAISFSGSASAYPPGTNPVIALDHNSGPVGDAVQVTGTHFTPNSTARLEFHSTIVLIQSLPTDGNGGFVVTIHVPNVALGGHQVVGVDLSTSKKASAAFTVTAAGAGSGSGGAPAGTGVAVVGMASVGLVLFVGGSLMVMAGRRRKVGAYHLVG